MRNPYVTQKKATTWLAPARRNVPRRFHGSRPTRSTCPCFGFHSCQANAVRFRPMVERNGADDGQRKGRDVEDSTLPRRVLQTTKGRRNSELGARRFGLGRRLILLLVGRRLALASAIEPGEDDNRHANQQSQIRWPVAE